MCLHICGINHFPRVTKTVEYVSLFQGPNNTMSYTTKSGKTELLLETYIYLSRY